MKLKQSLGVNCYNFELLIGINVGENSQTDLSHFLLPDYYS